MRKFLIEVFLILSLAGIFITGISYSQKYLYRFLISDYNRHVTIVKALNERLTTENILVFGGSRTMCGVDTRIIKNVLKFKGEIFNLSSVFQDLYESSYYYGFVNENTRCVIQCISSASLTRDQKHKLSDNVALSMFLSGYRINEDTRQLIKEFNPIFESHPLINYLKTRSVFRSYIHNIIRPLVDNEKFNEAARQSLYFPHLYTTDKHPDYASASYNCELFKIVERPNSQIDFLTEVNNYFINRGVTYVLVLMPVNPDQCHESYEEINKMSKTLMEETGVCVLDLSGLLMDGAYFYDAGHPNMNGARLISEEIGKFVNQQLLLSR